MGYRRRKTAASYGHPATGAVPALPRPEGTPSRPEETPQPEAETSGPQVSLPTNDIIEEDSAAMGRSIIVPAGQSKPVIDLRADAPGWQHLTDNLRWRRG
jgi:hypothetical protein